MQNIIEITNLNKRFTSAGWPWQKKITTEALCDINLTVKKGECIALLGPNGAGKTTLLKILSTLILPDTGEVKIAGLRIGKDDERIKSLIGLTVAEERSFYWRLTGKHNLEFFAALYGLNKKETKIRLEQLFKLFAIDYENKRFDAYSTGMKRKFILIRTLLHNPPILLLDEPTKSLDHNSSCELRELVKKLTCEGKTIIIATHNIEEAKNLCRGYIMLNKGMCRGFGLMQGQTPSLTETYLELV